MITRLLFLLLLIPSIVHAAPCSTVIVGTEVCDSFTQYGITMTLDTDYTVGQFVMGDYYIIDPGGGVTVDTVSPSWTGALHGSMKNPVPGAGQGFTSAGTDFEESLRVDYPVSLIATDSLVASVSETDTNNPPWDGGNAGSSDFTEDVLILSILNSIPANPTFRPAPTDRVQNLYTTTQIHTEYLPNKSTTGLSLPSHGAWTVTDYFERGTARPWIMFGNDWQSRAIHPKQNMFDYHGEIGPYLSELENTIMSDLVTTDMLHGFLQIVIDTFYANSVDSSNWAATIIIGGILLGDTDMYNYWLDTTKRTQRGHEKLFYPGTGEYEIDYFDDTYTSTTVPRGQVWTGYIHPVSGKVPMYSKQTNPAQTEDFLEHLEPSEWDCQDTCPTINQCYSWDYYIKYDVHGLVGMVLASQLIGETSGLDTKAMFNHDPIWDYVDRWMTESYKTGEWKDTGRTKYEEVIFYTGCSQGSGYLDSAGSAFLNDMWNTYRDVACPNTIPQGVTESCASVVKDGITWTFATNEEVFQFINGDYGVVDDGSVIISSLNPATTGTGADFRNGSMVNPTTTGANQAHDGRAGDFDESKAAVYPLALVGNESLVSTVSHTTTGPHQSIIGDTVQDDHGRLKGASILTCLPSLPTANSFRPGFSGSAKVVHNYSDIQLHLLPSLEPVAEAPEFTWGASWALTYADIYRRPWLNYGADWQGRAIHPTDNMPNYYRESFGLDAEAMSLLMCDIDDHNELLINFLQHTIDMAATAVESSYADRMMSNAVVTFGGLLLNDSGMLNTGYGFRETRQTYYGSGWNGQTVLWRDKVGLEFEETAPNDWSTIIQAAGCGCKAEAYRRDSHSYNWVGSALAHFLLDDGVAFNHPAYFDYTDRWMAEVDATDPEPYLVSICQGDQNTDGGTTCTSYTGYPDSGRANSSFVYNMWGLYSDMPTEQYIEIGTPHFH